MVYRRRPRKVYRKKKRSGNFRKKFNRRSRSGPTKIHYITRWSDGFEIHGAKDSSTTLGTLKFSLSSLSQHSDLTSVFRLYKIKAIKVVMTPTSNVTIADSLNTVAQTSYFNSSFTVIDTTSDSNPANLNDLRAAQSCKIKPNNVVVTRFLYPKPQLTVDTDISGGNITTNAPFNGWLHTSSSSVVHLGLKYGLKHQQITQDGGLILYDCYVKYYLMFKDTV